MPEADKEDLYVLKINCKEKRTVGKANKKCVKNNNRLKKLKIKIKKRKKKPPQNCKSPT